MIRCQLSKLLLLSLVWSFHLCNGVPIYESLEEVPSSVSSAPGFVIFVISAAIILLVSYFVIGCVCCPNKSIKALSYQNGFPVSRLNENNSLQFENPTEFAIFPPHSAVIDLQPVSLTSPSFDDKVTFEPLPDILPRRFSGQSAACSSRPAHFRALLKSKVSLHDWFDDPNSNFPRDHLQYISELGCGWFGRIVEGEASHICNNEEKTAVIVKILREEASPSEHLHFLHEVRPYRDISHPNVVRLLGRCLESDPFLLIMEHSISDLKSYLVLQESKDALLKKGIHLQMACNIASGLRCLHENGFVHMDFAAHNCFVCSDFSVKVGDYGTSFDRCREDYYCLGDTALPIRWCSPETLLCTETTIETKEITKEANIWAFGVVLWEIFEFGKLPYKELTNEEVLQKVLIERSVQLSPPSLDFPIKEEVSLVMKECWKSANSRPPMEKVDKFLTRLYNDRHNLKTLESSFEERWEALQHKVHEVRSIASDHISLKFENDFSERSDSHNYSSDGERFSSFENSFDVFSKNINGQLSPSLRVLNGSIDELTENDICLSSASLGRERSPSALSDRTLSNLDDDQGSQVGDVMIPDHVFAAVDLTANLQSMDASRHPAPQTQNENNIDGNIHNNFSYTSNKAASQSDVESLPYFKGQNSELPVLDSNYNELPFDLENHGIDDIVREPPASFRDLVPGNSHSFTSETYKESSNVLSGERLSANTIESLNIINQKRPCTLSSVPDIVVHESPSVLESFHDENENYVPDSTDVTPMNESPKVFRFVFKEASGSTDDSKGSQEKVNSDGASGSENTPDMENLSTGQPPLMKGRSHPLTSTPLKSTHDIGMTESSDSPEHFCNHDDSGSVFFTSSLSEIGSGKNEEDKTPPKPCSQVVDEVNLSRQPDLVSAIDNEVPDEVDLNDTSYYEATGCKTDATFKIKSSESFIKDKSIMCDQENYVSAQSTFHVNSCNAISESVNNSTESPLKVPQSNVNRDTSIKTVVVNIPTVSVENDCALSSVEAESSDKDYKWPSFQETKSDNINTDACSEEPHREDLLSLDYGDPVTPDVSFNISSCSYENEGKTFSNSSPGISSENIKDSEGSEYEASGSRAHDQRVVEAAAINQHNSGRNFVAVEANTGMNNLTLSEASSAEFLDSYSPASDSFGANEENRMEATGNLRGQKFNSVFQNGMTANHKTDLFYDEDDYEYDSGSDTNIKKSKGELRLHDYDEVIVEDLETGEQTIITDSYSACDDYENSAESDEILKINTETDEAIIVDSSEALIGFVPSRSIEMLQDCEIISNMNPIYRLDEERESSDSNHLDASNSASSSPAYVGSNASPYQSPEATHPLPYRNFSLQNEVIEEEITDEIATPSSIRSTASFSSNELYGEERMSQSSESLRGEVPSVMPCVDHFYDESSAEPSPEHARCNRKIDDYSESEDDPSECSPVRRNRHANHIRYDKDVENNHLPNNELQDVVYSMHPTQTVCWHSDETLDIERDSPIVLEGREIMAGGVLETRGMSVKDITTALHQLEVDEQQTRLSVSRTPSPYSSLESSPCREAYTPDFESEDTSDEESPSSCSSTSGSFECIHNKFKDSEDISKAVVDEETNESEYCSEKRQSPLKIFSKTWDCHATPTKGVLVTPEKKFNSLRKSVSFHDDPQVVFEYPPCSDSEEGPANEEINPWKVDYRNYADWELQVGENEEIEEVLEIEELDSEPYVRRPTYGFGSSVGPMNRPMLYSLTSGFSDDDMDYSDPAASDAVAPSNSPEEGKQSLVSEDQIGSLIRSQLNNLALEENRLKWMQDVLDQESSEFAPSDEKEERGSALQQDPGQKIEVKELPLEQEDILCLDWPSIDKAGVSEGYRDSGNWQDKFSNGKELPSQSVKEQQETKMVEDSFYSKLRLNTLVTMEEAISLNCSQEQVPTNAITNELNGIESDAISNSDQGNRDNPFSEITISSSNGQHDVEIYKDNGKAIDVLDTEVKDIVDKQELHAANTNLIDVSTVSVNGCPDPVQPVSLLDSIYSSGEFLLSSNASSMLDCPVMNGLSDTKYFDLNDTSIVHTESDNSGFMSSLEIKNDSEEESQRQRINQGNDSSSQKNEEIIPTLDFLNGDFIEVTREDLSSKEFPVLPLAMDNGNKRPGLLKFNMPDESSVLSDLITVDESTKNLPSIMDLDFNCLPAIQGKNIISMDLTQNINMSQYFECETIAHDLGTSHLNDDNPKLEAKEESNKDFISSKGNDSIQLNEKSFISDVLSLDCGAKAEIPNSCNPVIENASKVKENLSEYYLKESNRIEFVSDPCEISSSLLELKGDLPKEISSTKNSIKGCVETREKEISFQPEGDSTKEDFVQVVDGNSPVHASVKTTVGNVTSANKESFNAEDSRINNNQVDNSFSCLNNDPADLLNGSLPNKVDKMEDDAIVEEKSANIGPNLTDSSLVDTANGSDNDVAPSEKNLKGESIATNKTQEENAAKHEKKSSLSDLLVAKCSSSDFTKESALNDATETITINAGNGAKAKVKPPVQEIAEAVPQIVVTPASESEIEDELEEYLRNQLRLCHEPEATTRDNFSVTSQYSVRPFEDVFGAHGSPDAPRDYIEAYNFEFDSGDFFEDILDDFESADNSGALQQWQSPSVPPMVERSGDLMENQESSPLCYTSKDSTHL